MLLIIFTTSDVVFLTTVIGVLTIGIALHFRASTCPLADLPCITGN